MSDWLSYFLLAVAACAVYFLLGYLGRKTYNRVTEGKR